MGTKGTWKRKANVSDYELDLRWRLLRAPEQEKRALRAELEALERSEQHWNDYKKQQGVYADDN